MFKEDEERVYPQNEVKISKDKRLVGEEKDISEVELRHFDGPSLEEAVDSDASS